MRIYASQGRKQGKEVKKEAKEGRKEAMKPRQEVRRREGSKKVKYQRKNYHEHYYIVLCMCRPKV